MHQTAHNVTALDPCEPPLANNNSKWWLAWQRMRMSMQNNWISKKKGKNQNKTNQVFLGGRKSRAKRVPLKCVWNLWGSQWSCIQLCIQSSTMTYEHVLEHRQMLVCRPTSWKKQCYQWCRAHQWAANTYKVVRLYFKCKWTVYAAQARTVPTNAIIVFVLYRWME